MRSIPCDAAGVFRGYCSPASTFTESNGACDPVDCYGSWIRPRVRASPREFEAQLYPMGFVARHDPFGTFYPIFCIRREPSRDGEP